MRTYVVLRTGPDRMVNVTASGWYVDHGHLVFKDEKERAIYAFAPESWLEVKDS